MENQRKGFRLIIRFGAILALVVGSFLASKAFQDRANQVTNELVKGLSGVSVKSTTFNEQTSTVMLSVNTEYLEGSANQVVDTIVVRACEILKTSDPKVIENLNLTIQENKKGKFLYTKLVTRNACI